MNSAKKPAFEPQIVELDYEPRLPVDVAFDPPRPPRADTTPANEGASRSALTSV